LSSDNPRPHWQLPPGVSRGTWDYVNDTSIASDYNQFHAGHPLLELDDKLIQEHIASYSPSAASERLVAMDFGCGTGRNLLRLAAQGWNVVGVDLSQQMLDEFAQSAVQQELLERCGFVYANMVQADGLADSSADVVLCMYSSLGMVQGRENRRAFLKHVKRILKPDGLLFVHVHNRGSWLRDPGGMIRSMKDWWRALWDKTWEFGDRIYPYRGLPSMFLHIYSERELRTDLAMAELSVEKVYRLDRESKALLRKPLLPHLQSGGFIAVCRKNPR
jgi:SAM-dependent methyltransferase